jgi:heavy metal sensor kinase
MIILGCTLIFFSALVYYQMKRSLYKSVDHKIMTISEVVASSIVPRSGGVLSHIEKDLTEKVGRQPAGKFVQLLDRSGHVGEKSLNLRNKRLPVSYESLKNASEGRITYETKVVFGESLRIITYPIKSRSRKVRNIVQVASSLTEVEDTLKKLIFILASIVPLALIIASIGGIFLANKVLKPVNEINRITREITSKNLGLRVPRPQMHDELGQLVDTINSMIERLENSFSQIEQFTADASHELKTPLTILKGEAELALRKKREPEEYRHYLKSGLEEVNRLSRLVQDLLVLSKADTGRLILQNVSVNLSSLVEICGQQSKFLGEKGSVQLELITEPDVYVLGDSNRLKQMFYNLIENAIKYSNQGGKVTILTSRNGQYAKVAIRDHGVGISGEDIPFIFDRFYRVDKSRSREAGGTGLGLSICKWIAEAHNGKIEVESAPGEGSCFTVLIPLLAEKV